MTSNMSSDIRSLLDGASSTSPPWVLDSDAVVARGRERTRRRRVRLASGAVVGVATVTAATLALTSMLAPPTGVAPPPDAGPPAGTQPPPARTLPELDPSKHYSWVSRERVDDAVGAALTKSLVDHFAQHPVLARAKVLQRGPEFEVDGVTHKVTLVTPGAAGSLFGVARYTNDLVSSAPPGGGEAPPPAFSAPVYRLRSNVATGPDEDSTMTLDHLAGIELAVDGVGEDQLDHLRIALFPKGTYRSGHDAAKQGARQPLDGYLVEGCDAYLVTDAHPGTEDDRRFDFDCHESIGPDDARIVTVAAEETYLAHWISYTINTVVVYRTDGTAVVVSDTPQPGRHWKQGSSRAPGTPSLDLTELTAIALAMPLVAIA
jgi:hypothetical protein